MTISKKVGAYIICVCVVAYLAFKIAPSLSFYLSGSKAITKNEVTSSKSQTVAPVEIVNAQDISRKISKGPYKSPAPRELPGGPISENLSTIERQAHSGDYEIGYSLAAALMKCEMLDDQYKSLKEKLENKELTESAVDKTISMLDAQFNSCKGLSKEQLDSYPELLEFSAKHGSTNAQVSYPAVFSKLASSDEHRLDTAWLDNYKSNSIDFLNSAANNGNVDAMTSLGFAYWDGYLIPADKVRGYAYIFAVAQSGLVSSSSAVLSMWQQSMTESEIQDAIVLGNSIYHKCCS